MKTNRLRFCWAIGLALNLSIVVGCTSQPDSQDPAPVPEAAQDDSNEAVAELRLVDIAQFQEEMASRNGKVILLDMWATW